jgi:hypothetical protein
VSRPLLAISLVFYVALASGEAPVLGYDICAQKCVDDDDEGRCGPTCRDCACCVHGRAITMPAAIVALSSAAPPRTPERTVLVPPLPEPREILHIPIA